MPSCRPDFGAVRSYAAAAAFLATAKPYPETNKSDPHAAYRLEATRKRHMNIRLMDKWDTERAYIETFGSVGSWGGSVEHNELSQLNLRAASELKHIALRLYSTDVVVWREDGTIFFDPYVSSSTNAFVSNCTPSGLGAHYEPRACLVACGMGYFHDAGRRVYRVASRRRAAFKRDPARGDDWYPVPGSGIEPWSVPRVPRKAANAVLKAAAFGEFALWLTGFCAMTRCSYGQRLSLIAGRHAEGRREPQDAELVGMLADREQWQELARMPWFWPNLTPPNQYGPGGQWAYRAWEKRMDRINANPSYAKTLHARILTERVRIALYHTGNVITEVDEDFLVGYNNVTHYFRARKRYSDGH